MTRVLRGVRVPTAMTSCSWGRIPQSCGRGAQAGCRRGARRWAGCGAGRCWEWWRSWTVSSILSCANPSPDCPPSAGAAHLKFDEIRMIAPAAFVGSQRLLWHVESDPPALCVQRGRSRVGSRNPTRVVEPLLWPNTAIQGLRIHRAGIYLGKGQLVSSKSPVPGPAILLWEEGSL